MKAAEEIWEETFEDGSLCQTCEHLKCWDEHHPYGDTTASERLCDCKAPEAKFCPAVQNL